MPPDAWRFPPLRGRPRHALATFTHAREAGLPPTSSLPSGFASFEGSLRSGGSRAAAKRKSLAPAAGSLLSRFASFRFASFQGSLRAGGSRTGAKRDSSRAFYLPCSLPSGLASSKEVLGSVVHVRARSGTPADWFASFQGSPRGPVVHVRARSGSRWRPRKLHLQSQRDRSCYGSTLRSTL